jgi:hypothetical protein
MSGKRKAAILGSVLIKRPRKTASWGDEVKAYEIAATR